MRDYLEEIPSEEEQQIAIDTLERYSGSPASGFQPYLLLTNFPQYVEHFASSRDVPLIQGSMFSCAHSPEEEISILDFKIGSPAAALVIDLCCYLPIKSALLLGMCGGGFENTTRWVIISFRFRASVEREPQISIFREKFPQWPISWSRRR